MNTRTPGFAGSVLITAVVGSILWVNAGDLNPPQGNIAPTGRTPILTSTTPGDSNTLFRIVEPGSYYLRSNINGVADKIGIDVAVGGVTIDLQGFQLIGGPGSLDGICVTTVVKDVAVRNGTIRGWGGYGVNLRNADNGILDNLLSSNNTLDGIRTGKGSVVTACVARENGADGIDVDDGSVVSDCAVSKNGDDGIEAGFGCTVTATTASSNTFDGIQILAGCTVTNCTVYDNGDDGIQSGGSGTVAACTAHANGDDGIQVGAGSTVTGCTSYGNNDDGIQAGGGSLVARCTTNLNGDDGIVVAFDCRVIRNNCYANGNAGVHVASGVGKNRIEGNNVTDNLFGIAVDTPGNFIIQNTASGNAGSGSPSADFNISSGNGYGPIVDVNGAGDISETLNADHPWANFTY